MQTLVFQGHILGNIISCSLILIYAIFKKVTELPIAL